MNLSSAPTPPALCATPSQAEGELTALGSGLPVTMRRISTRCSHGLNHVSWPSALCTSPMCCVHVSKY